MIPLMHVPLFDGDLVHVYFGRRLSRDRYTVYTKTFCDKWGFFTGAFERPITCLKCLEQSWIAP